MSIQQAIVFLATAQEDDTFRRACYQCPSSDALNAFLQSKNMHFDALEFENATNVLLLKCTSESQAYRLHEIKNWYNLLLFKLQKGNPF